MRYLKKLLSIAAILIITSENSWAYLDPGTGSMIFQIAIGCLLTITFTLKLWWNKFVRLLTKLFRK
jgi:hypothetical protein